jgi:predicted glycogen debranching enzyme
MNLVGGLTRGDQAFFMAAKKAPNVRWNMVTGLLENLTVDGKEYVLTSQRLQGKDDLDGFQYLESFTFDNYPVWVYRVAGVTVTKTIVMVQGENTVAVQYDISNEKQKQVELSVKPMQKRLLRRLLAKVNLWLKAVFLLSKNLSVTNARRIQLHLRNLALSVKSQLIQP